MEDVNVSSVEIPPLALVSLSAIREARPLFQDGGSTGGALCRERVMVRVSSRGERRMYCEMS